MAELVAYRKPHRSSSELCDKLLEQGLTIANRRFAEDILEKCSYYRFKAYLIPFQQADKRFYPGATFEAAHDIYMFDSKLRSEVFRIIASVEIGVRSSFEQWMTTKTQNLFWYLDTSLFENSDSHIRTVNNVRNMFVESKELFAEHFRNKYFNEYCPFYRDLPPGWVAIELMTFGNLTKLMAGVTEESIQALKLNRYAKTLGVQKFKSLASWMATLQEVRNHCGHHMRLFNRNLKSPTAIKSILSPDIPLIKTKHKEDTREIEQLNRLYTAIAALQHLYTNLGYTEKLGPILASLFQQYPSVFQFHASMGFPQEWEKETIFF
ncbi:hypothetical protein GCM10010919_05950 [Alishewanella longhuensis]|uniref:Abi family protein n=1 Tax=Alishewanella longhuensis TaxID=1091037 RepID=A0ABQ3KVV3_9ALTE|nr:Abi family protein [Alishewanella longhuensis]GHG61469.1 hypothetical protein GCM10010919_05950 [Alishewanella longhuensis]